MNMHVDIQGSNPPANATAIGFLRRLVAILKAVLSAPRGDQGGWEGGARGL
jgi:hypothetical protein